MKIIKLIFLLSVVSCFADETHLKGTGYKIDYTLPTDCSLKGVELAMKSLTTEVKTAGKALAEVKSSAIATLNGTPTTNQNSWNIDSYLYSYSTYTGGAHSSNAELSFNYRKDDKSCKLLKLTDVVKISDGVLRKLITEKLKNTDFQANDSSLDPDFESMLDISQAYFYFVDEYLIIAFKEYAIAPYSTGIVRVRFTKSEIENLKATKASK